MEGTTGENVGASLGKALGESEVGAVGDDVGEWEGIIGEFDGDCVAMMGEFVGEEVITVEEKQLDIPYPAPPVR